MVGGRFVFIGIVMTQRMSSLCWVRVMDDMPPEVQAQLSSEHQSSSLSLSLGHVTRISGTPRQADFRGKIRSNEQGKEAILKDVVANPMKFYKNGLLVKTTHQGEFNDHRKK